MTRFFANIVLLGPMATSAVQKYNLKVGASTATKAVDQGGFVHEENPIGQNPSKLETAFVDGSSGVRSNRVARISERLSRHRCFQCLWSHQVPAAAATVPPAAPAAQHEVVINMSESPSRSRLDLSELAHDARLPLRVIGWESPESKKVAGEIKMGQFNKWEFSLWYPGIDGSQKVFFTALASRLGSCHEFYIPSINYQSGWTASELQHFAGISFADLMQFATYLAFEFFPCNNGANCECRIRLLDRSEFVARDANNELQLIPQRELSAILGYEFPSSYFKFGFLPWDETPRFRKSDQDVKDDWTSTKQTFQTFLNELTGDEKNELFEDVGVLQPKKVNKDTKSGEAPESHCTLADTIQDCLKRLRDEIKEHVEVERRKQQADENEHLKSTTLLTGCEAAHLQKKLFDAAKNKIFERMSHASRMSNKIIGWRTSLSPAGETLVLTRERYLDLIKGHGAHPGFPQMS